MSVRKYVAGLTAMTAALALSSAASAATMLWSFSGNSAADGPVNASALVTLLSGGLTVNLTDLLANPTSDGQELSGIEFTFSRAPTSSTLISESGTEIDIIGGSHGHPNTTTGDDNVIAHWGTTVSGGGVYLATVGTGALGGQPKDLIIGPGPYTKANASIIGKDPQIYESGIFGLRLSGLVPGDSLTKVSLQFGTSGSDFHAASCTQDSFACSPSSLAVPIPEPATWAMMIIGILGVGAALRRRRGDGAALARPRKPSRIAAAFLTAGDAHPMPSPHDDATDLTSPTAARRRFRRG